jgi:MFS family permease
VSKGPVAILRGLPVPVRILVAGTFVNKAGSFIVPFLTLVLRREFALSGEAVGVLMGAYGVGSVTSILAGGALTDRWGRRATLLASLLGSGLLAIAMGFAPSFRVFLPLLVVFGFIADLYRPAAVAMIADLMPPRDRVLGLAALRLAVNLGFAFGMSVGGVLADRSWRLLFMADGMTTLAFGLLVALLIAESRPAGSEGSVARARHSTASPWRDAVFVQMAAASLIFSSLFLALLTVLPLTVTLSAGYPARVYGVLVAVNGLLITLFEVPVVAWLRRFRRLRVASLGAVVAGIGFGATGLVPHWAWFLLTAVLWTAGEIMVIPQQSAFVADWAPPEARGRYLALYQATWSLGLIVAPLVFLPLHARMGEAPFWGLLTLPALPMAVTLRRLDRTADRPELLRGASSGLEVSGPS